MYLEVVRSKPCCERTPWYECRRPFRRDVPDKSRTRLQGLFLLCRVVMVHMTTLHDAVGATVTGAKVIHPSGVECGGTDRII
jgi:hypothetical protein